MPHPQWPGSHVVYRNDSIPASILDDVVVQPVRIPPSSGLSATAPSRERLAGGGLGGTLASLSLRAASGRLRLTYWPAARSRGPAQRWLYSLLDLLRCFFTTAVQRTERFPAPCLRCLTHQGASTSYETWALPTRIKQKTPERQPL